MARKKRSTGSQKSAKWVRQVSEILTLDDDEEIYEKLMALHVRYPQASDILELLTDYAFDLDDRRNYLVFLYRLVQLEPHRKDVWYALGTTLFPAGYPFLAWAWMRRGLELSDDDADEDTVNVRKNIERIEPLLAKLLTTMDLGDFEDPYTVAVEHDRIRFLLEYGEYADARKAAMAYLKRFPATTPILNNVSHIEFIDGNYTEAIAYTERVLEQDPQNIHALSNLIRFHLLLGDLDQATAYSREMAKIPTDRPEHILKKIEAFSYLGEDEAVLDHYDEFKAHPEWRETMLPPLFSHLVAVARARQGDEKEAKRLWRQALQLDPNFDLASENLEDLKLPPYKRNGAWAFSMGYWINNRTLKDLADVLKKVERRPVAADRQRLMRQFLENHPELEALMPILLERGDAESRQYYIQIADIFKAPRLMDALKAFAFGQAGPDETRAKVANMLLEAGQIEAGVHRMWVRGEWTDISLMNFEIYTEPVEESSIPPEAMDIVTEGVEALYENDYERARDCLLEASRLAPDSPSILNNLALAYERLGDQVQSRSLIHQVEERFPDYFFGILTRANRLTEQEKPDEAIDLLNTLLARRRFHISEYIGLCQSMITALIKKGERDGAKAWLNMWKDVDPDDPRLETWEMRIDPDISHLMKLFGKMLKR